MKKKSIICNSLIIILELIALIHYYNRVHTLSIEFYTMDSNILALITSLLFIIFINKDYEWIKDLRFITTSCLTVTFIVVVMVLCPMYNFNYQYFMFGDEMLYLHTLCPIISIISYIFFEKKSNKKYLGVLVTIIYAIILIILNIKKIVDGPYPFLKVYEQPIYMSILWFFIIIGGSLGIGILLNILNDKTKRG